MKKIFTIVVFLLINVHSYSTTFTTSISGIPNIRVLLPLGQNPEPMQKMDMATLVGKVIDLESKPISYATVLLLNSDSSFYKNEMTNKEGKFSFKVKPGNYIFKLSLFGKSLYRQRIQISDHVDMGLLKLNLTKELNTVTISGQRSLVAFDNDKLIFNVANSPLNKGYSGLEVLARSPKLQVNADGMVLLRNKSPLIYVNGRQMYLTGRDLASYLTGLNAEMIQSIEIQTNATAENDAAADAGIVNIILKKPLKGINTNLATSYTYRKGNTWSDYIGINTIYGTDKWNLYSKISFSEDHDFGRYQTTKLFINQHKNIANGSFRGEKRNLNLLGGIVFYPNKNHEFGAELYYNHGKGQYITPESLWVYDPDLSAISHNQRLENFRNKVWYGALNYTLKLDTLGSMLKFIVNTGHHENPSDNSADIDYLLGDYPSNQAQYQITPLSDYAIGQADLTKKYKLGFQLKTGLKWSSVNRNHRLKTSLFPPPADALKNDGQERFTNGENIAAIYGSLSGKLSPKSSFNIGLRLEHTDYRGKDQLHHTQVSKQYFNLFPRLYYAYTFASKKTLSISLSRGIQRPSFRDLNPFITKENDYSYIQGNPELQAQFSNNFELSYQSVRQSLSFYTNHTQDLIAGVYSNIGDMTYYKPENFGSQTKYGLDYSYYSNLNKWLYTNASIGAHYYQFRNGSLHPSGYAFTSNIYSRYKLSKTISADMLNVFNSRLQNYVVSASPQYRLDLSLQKDLLKGKAQLKFACSDVFNTQRDRSLSSYEHFSLDFYQKRRTRSFQFQLVYSFSSKQKIKNKAIDSSPELRVRL